MRICFKNIVKIQAFIFTRYMKEIYHKTTSNSTFYSISWKDKVIVLMIIVRTKFVCPLFWGASNYMTFLEFLFTLWSMRLRTKKRNSFANYRYSHVMKSGNPPRDLIVMVELKKQNKCIPLNLSYNIKCVHYIHKVVLLKTAHGIFHSSLVKHIHVEKINLRNAFFYI